MTFPLHEALRAVGQGILAGTVIAVPLWLAAAYLGPVGFIGAVIATGATLITVANSLKRREQRKTHIGGNRGQ
jgi:hypothetical protein